MTINLISVEEFDILMNIYTNYPKLSFQNNGFEYIDKSTLSVDEKSKFGEVTNILKKSVVGFSSFNNFRVRVEQKTSKPEIRLQYHWDHKFTGVGYLLIEELLNGFNEKV